MIPARLQQWLEQLLHTHDTPQRTALAYAVGVFFGFSPMLGLHTVLGVLVAFLFRLNRVAVIVGIYSNLPWLVPAYYTVATLAGAAVLRVDIPPGLPGDLRALFTDASWGELRRLAGAFAPLMGAFLLGSSAGAIILSAVAYRLSLAMILAHRKRQELPIH